MCLDYVCEEHKIKRVNPFSISRIAKITKTNIYEGTILAEIENINPHLKNALPPIRLILHRASKFTDLTKELDNNIPVIALINPPENHNANDENKLLHAIILVEYDETNHIVYYDDPEEDNETTAIQHLNVGTFRTRWEPESIWVQIEIDNKHIPLTIYSDKETTN